MVANSGTCANYTCYLYTYRTTNIDIMSIVICSILSLKVRQQIHDGIQLSDDIRSYARGPSGTVHRYGGYCINGFRFNTIEIEKERCTQNSGIFSSFSQLSYASSKDQQPREGEIFCYGQVEDIIEIFYGYQKDISHVLFKVRWCEQGKHKDRYGFTTVNLNKEIFKNEKFMLDSHAKQCFYVKDIMVDDAWVVLRNPQRAYAQEDAPEDDNEYDDNIILLSNDVVADFSTEQNNETAEDVTPLRVDIPNLEIHADIIGDEDGIVIMREESPGINLKTADEDPSSGVRTRSQRASTSKS